MKKSVDENIRIRNLISMPKGNLPLDGGPDFNRLIFSASPYLLQHAENPVDWYPWGEEAFIKALSEDKPVFLSIGYSTCHWCHVMAHESFEDPEVAAVLNSLFVCIKVDREERPDIDEQYMTVAQIMTGSGGWPLNIFMTPEKSPFYATTYIPRQQKMGMPGIIQVLEYFDRLWRVDREKLKNNAASTLSVLENFFAPEAGLLPEISMLEKVNQQLLNIYDDRSGGFGTAPKFPMPLFLDFLIRYRKRNDSGRSLAVIEQTLRNMRYGGIYDQLGFGFHRYSVDSEWRVPHFEKMLYDQALIGSTYLETFQVTSNPFYLKVAEEILSFVFDEMASCEGGFIAGLDADTEGEEGTYYLWTHSEIEKALGEKEAALFCQLFDVTAQGNFEGKNILHLQFSPKQFSADDNMLPESFYIGFERWRSVLLKNRRERVRPFRDEKIVTAWNSLMITTLAKGYAISSNKKYLTAAKTAVDFIFSSLVDPSLRLMRSYHLGKASGPGYLEDYAAFIGALIELHQVTLETNYLEQACFFADEMQRLFGQEAGGALYETGIDAEKLLVRHISAHDGVIPSGNSMAVFDLLRLARITGDLSYQQRGEAILHSFMGTVARQPVNSINFFSAFAFSVSPEFTVTISGAEEDLSQIIYALNGRYIPNLALRYGGCEVEGEFPVVDNKPTSYVCAKNACQPPLVGAQALVSYLDEAL
ncbi:thioredoxin domain-containing protein [Geoanaerobacter pelophilus]|uniref:thioredoxin domain-containing protein n=1 Tax=Geoanaerobacter pelophilus TaxID=60036 RepID=UPI00307F73A4